MDVKRATEPATARSKTASPLKGSSSAGAAAAAKDGKSSSKRAPDLASLKKDKKQLTKSGRAHDLHKIGGDKIVSRKDFKEIRLIGRGNVGKVYLVRLRGTKELYAMKVLEKEEMIKKNKVKRVMTEREILAVSQHPFIVTLHWCWQSSDCIYFVMDYCAGGEFFRVLQRMPNKCLREDAVRFYCAEVLLALEYLHIMGFIYRDLKPENLLLHESGHIKLTDFDLSKASERPTAPHVVREMFGDIKKVSTLPDLVTNSFVGTAEYIAPEVISGYGHSGAVDWWTFGILMYEMLYGRAPFKGNSREEIFKNIMDEKLKFPDDVPVSKEAKKMMKALLTPDVKKRLGSQNGASDLKSHPFFAGINWALVRDMKPPIVPRVVLDEEGLNKRSVAEEEDRSSRDQAAKDPAAHKDPFADFQAVSKAEQPSEIQLSREEQNNIENEVHGAALTTDASE